MSDILPFGHSVYLIGLPGCGKSVLGRTLARDAGLPFTDLDTDIVTAADMPIPQFFAERGEAAFRDLETRVLHLASITEAQVIATGGGIILREDNVARMRATGIVLWIDRPLERILSDVRQDTRPLLAGDARERLMALHAAREPLYRAAAHLRLVNTGTRAQAVRDALALLRGFVAEQEQNQRGEQR